MWGTGFDGSLGDNTTIGKLSPVQTISGGTNWKEVALGKHLSLAIREEGDW
jgi:hypothetical protein